MQHKKNQTSPTKKLKNFLLISFVTHFGLALAIFVFPQFKSEKKSDVEVVLIEKSESNIENIISARKTETLKMPNQVVQTDETQSNNQLNEKARFLSAKNNTVKKETVAKNVGQFKNTNSKLNAPKQNAIAEIEKQIANSKNIPPKSKLFDTGFDAYASLNKNQAVKKIAQKEHSFQNGKSQQEASSTNDHIETAEPSLMTQLNTREYKYYGYHKRIRTQLDQWYESKLRDQMKKIMSQGRTIATEENKRTQLLIILNDKGNLVKIQVMGASGVRELDDAAVEAFRKAAPFPNPPKGMIDNDGTIKVRWDFVLS